MSVSSAVNVQRNESPEASQVLDQLARILSSELFKRSPRSTVFLKFVVEQTLSGRAEFIKARSIAIAVFDRNLDDNPDDDSIVRIQAGRVRKRLSQYYQQQGARDPVHISIPTGAYTPVFRVHQGNGSREDAAIGSEASVRPSRAPRIAVLPLKNLTASKECDYFVDGLGHELSAKLSRFQGLAVLAYSTSSHLRDEELDLRAASPDLKVDFFVGGSVARHDDEMRINIECLDAKTGDEIWGECFKRNLINASLFEIQDELACRVVCGVGDDFGAVSRFLFHRSRNKRVEELSPYEAVLSVYYFAERLDRESCDRAIKTLKHAIEIEPTYAPAWAALSHVYCNVHSLGLIELDEALTLAEDCAHRAMTLDKDCQHTHFASAYVGGLMKDHQRVGIACDNIIEINPNAVHLAVSAAFWLAVIGRFDQAFAILQRSRQANYSHPGWTHFVTWLHAFSSHDFGRALEAAYRFNMPMLFWDPLMRAAALGKLGREREAAGAVQELIRLHPDFVARPDFYVGCFVHSETTRSEVMDGLQVGGLTLREVPSG